MTSKELITELYIGYFDRAPDPAGLDFWVGVLDGGALTLEEIAQDFATQPETKTTYPFLETPPTPENPASAAEVEAFINAIYDNLFDRAPDTAGFDFWSGVLQDGFSPGTFILAVIGGASAADRAVLDNKIEVGCAWVEAADAEDGFVLTAEYIDGSGAALGDVSADPASVDAGKNAAALFFQEAPSVELTGTTLTLAEDADLTGRLKVADIVVTDDGQGTNDLTLAGADAALFEIDGTELFLVAGAALDFETNAALDVTVAVDDASIGSSPDDTADLTIALTDVDEAPTVALENVVSALSEGADTSAATKVADIVVTDDASGTADLALTGAGAAFFEITGTGLFLKAGSVLDFESTQALNVSVTVDDPALGGTPDDTADLSLAITDENEAPTVSLTNGITTLSEDTDTAAGLKVADIVVIDDALGTNDLTLAGADAALFEILGTELRLKVGAVLDFETNATLDVGISVDDATVGASPDDGDALSITVTDVNEPAVITVTPTVASLAEDTSTAAAIKVADVTVTDDGQGSNTLVLTGDDAGLFELVGDALFLKAGTVLDFETNPSLDVNLTADDATIPGSPDTSVPLSVAVTDVNEAPEVALENPADVFLETVDTSARIKVADIVLSDDGQGTNVLALTGADAALFEIDGAELFLKAGTVLNFEANPNLDVSVTVDDASVGASPDDIANLSIEIADNNAAPEVALSGVPASLSEDLDTTTRVKVADIIVTDDLAGTNTLALAGSDAGLFEIDGTELFLKAGTTLDFETNPTLGVAVSVDDPTLGTGAEDTASVAITVTDANEVPSVSLTAAITVLAEDANTASRTKVADIVVTDDAIGTNDLALIGADAGLFEIDGTELFLIAGAALDFETNPLLDVSVTVDDAAIGASPDGTAPFVLNVTNVNEAPTVALTGTQTELFEGTNTTSRVQVATIALNDDGTGTNVLSLTGADAGLFEIDGTGLFLKAGTVLDADANPALDVSVEVDDATLGGTPDDSAALSVAVNPGAPGAAADDTETLTFIGSSASVVRFGQINVADADPDTPGDQPGFVINTNPDGDPYAGVAGNALNLIDATGHDGLVSLGVISTVNGTGFTLDNSGSAGDIVACLGEGDVFGTLTTPELDAAGTWSFDNSGAIGAMEISIKDLDLNAGGNLNFLNVDIVIDGDIDLTVLGDDLNIDAASTLEVADGGTLTLTVAQVDDLEDAGVVIFGEGSVVVTGESSEDGTAATDDIDTNFGILQTATVDLSAVTLGASDTDDAVAITVSGAASDEAGTDLVVDGNRVAQTVIGTAHNDAVVVASSAADASTSTLDVILELGADSGDIGDPLDTPVGTADPAEMVGDTIDLDSAILANVQINADAGFDTVIGTGFSSRVDVQVASGAEFYAPVVASDYAATASSSNDGTAVLEAVGLLDRTINVLFSDGAAGWTVIGGAGSTDTNLIGGIQNDTLIDGIPDDDNNNNEEDVFTGNAGLDTFVFNIGLSDVGEFSDTTTTLGSDVEEIEILAPMASPTGDTLQFNMRIGPFAPAQILLVDGVDGADLSTTTGIATALAAALNARADVTASLAGSTVTATGANGGRVDLINVIEDPGGAPVVLTDGVDYNYDDLDDSGAYGNDPVDTGDDDRAEIVLELSGATAIGETYTVEVTRSDGSQFSATVLAATTDPQDVIDDLADALELASGGDIGFVSAGGGTAPAGGDAPLSSGAIAANTLVAFDENADNGGFSISEASGTASISGASSSSLIVGGETTVAAIDPDVINDFVSGSDSITFGLGAGTNSNYDEGAEVADFATALADANAAMDGTVIYYLTSSAAAGEEGLLFYDANADGTADALVHLVGIDSTSFDADDII